MTLGADPLPIRNFQNLSLLIVIAHLRDSNALTISIGKIRKQFLEQGLNIPRNITVQS